MLNADRPSKVLGLISVIWLLPKYLRKNIGIPLLIFMLKYIMDFLIDTILVVFGEMVIQQTTYYWNKQPLHPYLSFITISFYLIYDL